AGSPLRRQERRRLRSHPRLGTPEGARRRRVASRRLDALLARRHAGRREGDLRRAAAVRARARSQAHAAGVGFNPASPRRVHQGHHQEPEARLVRQPGPRGRLVPRRDQPARRLEALRAALERPQAAPGARASIAPALRRRSAARLLSSLLRGLDDDDEFRRARGRARARERGQARRARRAAQALARARPRPGRRPRPWAGATLGRAARARRCNQESRELRDPARRLLPPPAPARGGRFAAAAVLHCRDRPGPDRGGGGEIHPRAVRCRGGDRREDPARLARRLHRGKRRPLTAKALLLAALLLLSGCQPKDSGGPAEKDMVEHDRGVGLMGKLEFDAAHKVFVRLAERHPRWFEARFDAALAQLNRQAEGDERAATEALHALLKEHPGEARILYPLGLIALRSETPQNAEALLRQALDADARDAYDAYFLAQSLLAQGRAADALPLFERADALDPGLRSANYGAAQAL